MSKALRKCKTVTVHADSRQKSEIGIEPVQTELVSTYQNSKEKFQPKKLKNTVISTTEVKKRIKDNV